VCDEIFGGGNFINNVIWQKKYSPQNDARYFSDMHDFIITYAKNKTAWGRNLLPRTEAQNKRYKNADNDPRGEWKPSDLSVKTYNSNSDYPIPTPSGRLVNPPNGRCWGVNEDKFGELVQDNRIWFGANGSNVPSLKKFMTDVQTGTVPLTIWLREEVGDNQEAKQVLKQIFDDGSFPFDTPKPSRLIERILNIATNKEDIILDSFAGSGTTAHAVLNLNKQDGGNRKFICIEMEDYAETITAERVKRVIKGYGEDKKAVEGTGGSFDFYTLGEALFDEEGNLNESVGLPKIRNYVWYTETKSPLVEEKHLDTIHCLGKHLDTGYYFNYEAEAVTTLDHTFLASMKTKAEQYVIYADTCLLNKAFMVKHHIIFKKIPRDITRF
jgi:adenine-specific DNA-methyltransferase